ncbi:MAG TPA: precorrin-3B C(17)-methyltransferase [Desulfobacteraceae bacterium]|nr:precorrin-3B C(17)-methyltransferase [Desulfobacteraceae bacterium]|tara:strand:+ start:64 stop:858 length:795 start_codon:yes stop_codon:yes gene_type:complete
MKLFIVGTGPGHADHMSARARDVIQKADTVAGYTTYIDLIADLVKDKPLISTGMMKEIDRVEQAIDTALSGSSCALVSGGDPGIYAMAGLVFELCAKREIPIRRPGAPPVADDDRYLELEVVPGIPALAAGAALAGAPLTHDFAAISLSDLLTQWESIEKRISCAAMADFVIVLYNPKSKKRDWQLARAQELILEHRPADTPVGVITGAMRENQAIEFTTLDQMDQAEVGMQTVLFVGSTSSLRYMDFLFTPRGYTKKYMEPSN